jgi:type II secretory pathway component PulK
MGQNKKGVILISVLWVVLILSLVAWGFSRRSAMEVSVLDAYHGKLRSYAAARGGINYVLSLMSQFPSAKDSLYALGVTLPKDKKPQDLFAHIGIGSGTYAMVQWKALEFGNDQPLMINGLQDEQGKINVNAINEENYQILSALFELKGLSHDQSDQLALDVVAFRNGKVTGGNFHLTEQERETALKPKNKPYDHLLELLEVNGMTRDIFDRIKNDVSVYGEAQNGLLVNVRTANNNVIQAVVNAAKRMNPSMDDSSVLNQVYAIRDGSDGQPFTEDDGQSNGAYQGDIRNWPPAFQESNAYYLKARVIGVDENTGMRSVIEAVIQRIPGVEQNRIVAWQRD